MVTQSRWTVGAEIRWVRIFLFGLNPVNVIVIGVKRVVIELVTHQTGKENKRAKPENQIGEV